MHSRVSLSYTFEIKAQFDQKSSQLKENQIMKKVRECVEIFVCVAVLNTETLTNWDSLIKDHEKYHEFSSCPFCYDHIHT